MTVGQGGSKGLEFDSPDLGRMTYAGTSSPGYRNKNTNLYAFVANNPINLYDPLGLQSTDEDEEEEREIFTVAYAVDSTITDMDAANEFIQTQLGVLQLIANSANLNVQVRGTVQQVNVSVPDNFDVQGNIEQTAEWISSISDTANYNILLTESMLLRPDGHPGGAANIGGAGGAIMNADMAQPVSTAHELGHHWNYKGDHPIDTRHSSDPKNLMYAAPNNDYRKSGVDQQYINLFKENIR